MRSDLDDLEAELRRASETGELCARRSRRLRERSRQLAEYALEHVAQGDEAAARSALQIKASVREALASATRRALANAALASKLEAVIEQKQASFARWGSAGAEEATGVFEMRSCQVELLQSIREARAQLERWQGGGIDQQQQRELRRATSGGRRERGGGAEGGGGGSSSSGRGPLEDL
ncbi:hypothetical protein MNEG_11970 [Monoraphidium neglectum]|uniref:Uncharacterized protein n=1 Tax=Monoraphidium neglectum TaxID=145388 RepID=A0A0D2M3U7_9CHLO|nr:hypothetical protein MNEG_11970 [Monoraphidium neglectum]KIY95991.1 hypothetical protein MNEG_11970 [Monoraphidium neglectum]|eukprot:XP_013895011.1 hypothetical protein MNEG_11970 [Monoraphidium neglectum]